MSLDIQKAADEADDGTFSVRTNGLQAMGHAELEVLQIPRVAVEAAAKLLDYVLESVIEQEGSRLLAGENVGLPLSVGGHEEIPAVFVGVHAVESVPPKGGFFATLRGAAHSGVLQLVDLPGPGPGVPLAALASMMLYRANCRVALEDVEGAVAELEACIEMTPRDSAAGPPPEIDTHDADLNWQNHQSYLRLAELVDPPQRSARYAEVFSRFDWLAQIELGCAPDALRDMTHGQVLEDATKLLQHNLADPGVSPGPHDGLRMIASPLWTLGEDGTVVREAALIPAGFVDYCFGERLASPDVARSVAELAAQCLTQYAAEPWTISFLTKLARSTYGALGMPSVAVPDIAYRPWHFLASAVIAEAARYLRAGATIDELRETFGVAGGPPAMPESLETKLDDLETWETEQYTQAMGA